MGMRFGLYLGSEQRQLLIEAVDLLTDYLSKKGMFDKPDADGLTQHPSEEEQYEIEELNNLKVLLEEGPSIRNIQPKHKPNQKCPCGSKKKYKKCCGK